MEGCDGRLGAGRDARGDPLAPPEILRLLPNSQQLPGHCGRHVSFTYLHSGFFIRMPQIGSASVHLVT